MAKRTWTYEEITEEAESAIRVSMELAKERQAQCEYDSAARFRNFAWGKYCMWDTITAGHQESGDAERLEALTEVQHG